MRSRVLLVMLCCLGLLLSACAKPAKQSQPVQQETHQPGPVTLTVLMNPNPLADHLIQAFQDKNPDVRVKLIPINWADFQTPGSWQRWVKEQVSTGKADIAVDGNLVAMTEQLADLGPYIQKSGLDLKPFGSLDPVRHDGKLHVLPMERSMEVLVYNKDLFAKANVPAPRTGWTWSEFRDAAAKITRLSNGIMGVSVANPATLASLYTGRDGDFRDGVRFTVDLIMSDKSMPAPPENPIEFADDTPFLNGQVGMELMNLSAFRREARANWDFAPFPTRPGHPPEPAAFTVLAGISAASQHPDEAWQLLQFMTGPEGSALAAKEGAIFSYMTPEVKAAWFSRTPTPSPNSELLFGTNWVTRYAFAAKKLSPEEEKQMQELSQKSEQALRACFTDGAHWESHYAEREQLNKQITALTTQP